MYSGNRAEMREVFFRAWRNYRDQRPLEGIEQVIVDVALQHPEYHATLETREAPTERDYPPALGETNPFMHMGLHIAIAEQLMIDQPPGVRECYRLLLERWIDRHVVEHRMMECLSETVWQAARAQQAPDQGAYLECLKQLVRHR